MIVVADAADGTDCILTGGAHRNRPRSRASCSAKSQFHAQRAKERLCATQSAGEFPGVLRPTLAVPRAAVMGQLGTHTQKLRSTSRPRATVRHNLPHPSSYWI